MSGKKTSWTFLIVT